MTFFSDLLMAAATQGGGAAPVVDPYGSELIQNGGFASGANWTLSGPSIGGGVLNYAGTIGPASATNDTASPKIQSGKTYHCVYTITAYTSGTCFINVGGVAGTGRTAAGTYTQDLSVSEPDEPFIYTSSIGATFSVDNVSVKAVNPVDNLMTSGDMQSGTDQLKTSGDMQSGSDTLYTSGT